MTVDWKVSPASCRATRSEVARQRKCGEMVRRGRRGAWSHTVLFTSITIILVNGSLAGRSIRVKRQHRPPPRTQAHAFMDGTRRASVR